MRRITVSVIPKASREVLEWLSEQEAKAWVHAAPEKGKANEAVRTLVARELGVRPSQVRIVQGERSRKKVLEVD
ncbi:MAG: hypothetical protein KatS3mg115_0920 [Candidatus Poribacteria bacterium]|nr:MAG: hypothetical protein KatS3mg115_0920 [Candidatus Poribacteria bacterium]